MWPPRRRILALARAGTPRGAQSSIRMMPSSSASAKSVHLTGCPHRLVHDDRIRLRGDVRPRGPGPSATCPGCTSGHVGCAFCHSAAMAWNCTSGSQITHSSPAPAPAAKTDQMSSDIAAVGGDGVLAAVGLGEGARSSLPSGAPSTRDHSLRPATISTPLAALDGTCNATAHLHLSRRRPARRGHRSRWARCPVVAIKILSELRSLIAGEGGRRPRSVSGGETSLYTCNTDSSPPDIPDQLRQRLELHREIIAPPPAAVPAASATAHLRRRRTCTVAPGMKTPPWP